MRENFTPESLIRFLYKECSPLDSLAIKEAIAVDPALKLELKGLRKAYRELPKVTFRPSVKVIENVLNYSKMTLVENA